MPKLRGATYGLWLEIVQPEVKRFIAEWPGSAAIPRAYVSRMVQYAANPERMLCLDQLKLDFARAYSQSPDFVLGLLSLLRKLFAGNSKRMRIQRFLAGQSIAVNSYGKRRNTWDLTSEEIAENIGRGVSPMEVRKFEKLLRDRAEARIEFFPMKNAPTVCSPKRPKKER